MANILIVEDDTDLREGLSFSFSNDGHHVEEVETKKDGLRKISNGCFDLIPHPPALPEIHKHNHLQKTGTGVPLPLYPS